MSPKKAGSAKKGSARKAAPKAPKAPKASPMQKAPEPAHGPNVGSHDAQAQIAHTGAPADMPAPGRASVEVAPPNSPPVPTVPSPLPDQGAQR